jgi:hypothetical protein
LDQEAPHLGDLGGHRLEKGELRAVGELVFHGSSISLCR